MIPSILMVERLLVGLCVTNSAVPDLEAFSSVAIDYGLWMWIWMVNTLRRI